MKNEKSKALITQTITFLAIAALAYGSPSLAKKPTGDTTPPGVITDLAVDEGAETFKTVTVRWTAPAEDDDSGGTVAGYHVWCEPVGCENDACGYGQCECESEDPPVAPGEIQTCEVAHYNPGLVPSTEYWFTVRAFDDAGNVADWSNDVHEFTDSLVVDSWHRETVPGFGLDETLGHDFVDDDHVLIAGFLGERYQVATGTKDQDGNWGWAVEEIPSDIMINPYTWPAVSFALDPLSGTAAFGASTRPEGQQLQVLYTYYHDSQWVHEVVESPGASALSRVQLAFDSNGIPALAYTARFGRSEVGELRLARKGEDGSWTVTVVDAESGLTHPSLVFGATDDDLLLAHQVEIGDPPTKAIRFAILSETGQEVDNFMTPGHYGVVGLQVIWNPLRGDFDAGFQQMGDLSTCEHSFGEWLCQVAFYARPAESWWLDIDDLGETLVAYDTWSDDPSFARSADPMGLGDWAHEIVDYAWLSHNFQPEDSLHWLGAHLALAPAGGPTLSWMWNREIDYEPVERYTYFGDAGVPTVRRKRRPTRTTTVEMDLTTIVMGFLMSMMTDVSVTSMEILSHQNPVAASTVTTAIR